MKVFFWPSHVAGSVNWVYEPEYEFRLLKARGNGFHRSVYQSCLGFLSFSAEIPPVAQRAYTWLKEGPVLGLYVGRSSSL